MVLPRLIHPLATEIQPHQPDQTIQNEIYREPVESVSRGPTYMIQGQWKWFGDRELRMQKIGAQEESDGYVLLRRRDLAALGQKISINDRIVGYGVGVGRVDLDVYVVKLRHEGHYPDQGGPALLKAFFLARQPGRQSSGVQ